MKSHGFTLIEVVVATAIISIGVLVITALQQTSFALAGTTNATQHLLTFTQTELALQKQRATSATAASGCLSAVPAGTTCLVAWTPCTLTGNVITCDASAPDPIAFHVRVTTTGPRDAALDLWALAVHTP